MPTTSRENETKLVVREKIPVAESVVELVLARPGWEDLPAWSPGSHLHLIFCDGLERQYSLCGDPMTRHLWRVAVLREQESRGGSIYVHDTLTAGAMVLAKGPRNTFELAPSPRYRFIAGGIGITPILPMLAAADSAGADWQLLYGGRSRSSMAYVDDLRSRYGNRIVVRPQDEYGLLPLDEWLGEPANDTLVYCCGPEPLLRAVDERCAKWRPGSLHVERFTARTDLDTGANTSFEVELARSGLTVTVPSDRSILRTIEDAGLHPLYSCEQGECGTCETTVLSGTPDHRDSILTEEEQATGSTMMICVSRARSPRLVLDL